MAEYKNNKKLQANIKSAQIMNRNNNGQDPEDQKKDELELLEKYLVRTDSPTQT